MSTLPRLKPRTYWESVEIGLIRPGPIQGGSVHPYIARRNGAPWQHPHPLMSHALDRTLGVPLFQEQIMQLAMDVAGLTAAEADLLRRAMGAKRSTAKMDQLRERLFDGMAANGITGELAERMFVQIKAFSGYGFPMSHALSFAHLVFVSAYLKRYHPAAFCAALLRAQPMGFYSPQSLVADAGRHGIAVRGVDIHASGVHATLDPDPNSAGGHAVRLGLAAVRTLSAEDAERIVAERTAGGPYTDLADLARRTGLHRRHLEEVASAGALTAIAGERRQALWSAGAAARDRTHVLPGTTVIAPAPALPGMTPWELVAADVAPPASPPPTRSNCCANTWLPAARCPARRY